MKSERETAPTEPERAPSTDAVNPESTPPVLDEPIAYQRPGESGQKFAERQDWSMCW